MIKNCFECGKEYNTSHIEQNFCSPKCWHKYQSVNMVKEKAPCWKGGKITKICIICGKKYSIHPSKDKNNRIIFENIPINLFYVEQDASCRFISCELEYNNIKYDMILKTNIDNFNIVKNRIDNKFVIYYLKNILNISVDDAVTSENIIYTINIIDQNVNLRTIGEKEQLVFLKNNYYSY